MSYRQYTHCVDIKAYKGDPRNSPAIAIALGGIFAAFFLGPVGLGIALVAGYWAWQQFCAYILGGKLICLGDKDHPHDQCVIGRIMELEEVGYDKPFPQDIDNDYSIDLLLAPHVPVPAPPGGFSKPEDEENAINTESDNIKQDGVQGFLIKEQDITHNANMPFTGYNADRQPLTKPEPVLHGEFEGSRAHDVCEAAQIPTLIPSAICDIPIIGTIICAIATAAIAPIVAGAAIGAWFGAHDGDPADAARDSESGTLAYNDLVIIKGEWVYDAGHNIDKPPAPRGWNEIHPIKSVQKIPEQIVVKFSDIWVTVHETPWPVGNDQATYDSFRPKYDLWCQGTSEIDDPGVQDNQKKPENRWYLHPLLDGCEPQQPTPQPPH
jgi:hypothetical protein